MLGRNVILNTGILQLAQHIPSETNVDESSQQLPTERKKSMDTYWFGVFSKVMQCQVQFTVSPKPENAVVDRSSATGHDTVSHVNVARLPTL